MMLLRLFPVILSFVVLAAHFSRHDIRLLALACLAVPALLLVRRPWVPRALQWLLVLGALEWMRTTAVLVSRRITAGEDWLRMAAILVTVATLTLVSTLVFRARAVREHYASE
ncbi:MAG: hypothetical protein IH616_22915 [Gemmatimonadales bacterium]|nr:hypothetical protein [Gemmatimonadales bacterium]